MPIARAGALTRSGSWLLALLWIGILARDAQGLIAVARLETPEPAARIVVSKQRAYVMGPRLEDVWIFDVSRPSQPAFLGTVETPGTALDTAVVDEVAYVADGEAGLHIVDVSDPASPIGLGSIASVGKAELVAVERNLVFLVDRDAVGFGTLRIFDVTNPATPVPRGSLPPIDGASGGIQVSDDVVYLADGSAGLRVIDVSDPDEPSVLATRLAPEFAWDVELLEQRAYVTTTPRLRIFDISNPADPRELTAPGPVRRTPILGHLAVLGDQAYATDQERGLVVIDVSNPIEPRELASLGGANARPQDVAIVGNFAYVGTRVIDVSLPTVPTEVGRLDTAGTARDAVVSASVAFVADDGAGLAVFDVSDPALPRRLGAIDVPGSTRRLAVAGGRVYLASAGGGLRIIDVSEPSLPTELGSLGTPGTAVDVDVDEEIAYVADGDGGLRVVDVSDPSQPKEIGAHETSGYALRVVARGDRVFVVLAGYAVLALDVSDPTRPTTLGMRLVPGVRALFLVADLGFAAGARGLSILDVSDPVGLSEIGAVDCFACFLRDIEVAKGFAFATDQNSGVRIFDVSDARAARELGALAPPSPFGITTSAGRVYVSEGRAGVRVIDFGPEYVPEPSARLLTASALVVLGLWRCAGWRERRRLPRSGPGFSGDPVT